MQQTDLLLTEKGAFAGPDFLAHAAWREPVFVLPCGRRKLSSPAQARDLYTSPRFCALRSLAEALDAPYVIASARHGLVSPETVLSPYDEDLSKWSPSAQADWGHRVLDGLSARGGEPIVLLTETYAAALVVANQCRTAPLSLYAPLACQSVIEADEWVEQALQLAARVRDVRALYAHIEEARRKGHTFSLRELSNRALPEKGVYVFLDPDEPSAWTPGPRIVRIGTHAVSEGSKSSLRTRLKNHLGPAHGAGSHRGSIFRLHVGRAMLEAEGRCDAEVLTWGVGQQAPKPVPHDEVAHERRVTDYLQRLEVYVIDIDDPPSKTSLRAHAEKQLIGLMTADGLPLDPASPGWLGRRSPMQTIREMGLWNIRDVGAAYRPDQRGSVIELLR